MLSTNCSRNKSRVSLKFRQSSLDFQLQIQRRSSPPPAATCWAKGPVFSLTHQTMDDPHTQCFFLFNVSCYNEASRYATPILTATLWACWQNLLFLCAHVCPVKLHQTHFTNNKCETIVKQDFQEYNFIFVVLSTDSSRSFTCKLISLRIKSNLSVKSHNVICYSITSSVRSSSNQISK